MCFFFCFCLILAAILDSENDATDGKSEKKDHHGNKDGYQCLMKLASVLDSAQNQRFDSTFSPFVALDV